MIKSKIIKFKKSLNNNKSKKELKTKTLIKNTPVKPLVFGDTDLYICKIKFIRIKNLTDNDRLFLSKISYYSQKIIHEYDNQFRYFIDIENFNNDSSNFFPKDFNDVILFCKQNKANIDLVKFIYNVINDNAGYTHIELFSDDQIDDIDCL